MTGAVVVWPKRKKKTKRMNGLDPRGVRVYKCHQRVKITEGLHNPIQMSTLDESALH